jgi:hypothetical protein
MKMVGTPNRHFQINHAPYPFHEFQQDQLCGFCKLRRFDTLTPLVDNDS